MFFSSIYTAALFLAKNIALKRWLFFLSGYGINTIGVLKAASSKIAAAPERLIAKSETRQALFQASHDTMIDMGIDGKEWVLGSGGAEGNCEYCQANAAQGIIPVTEEFINPESDIHPGCTCAMAPARLPK